LDDATAVAAVAVAATAAAAGLHSSAVASVRNDVAAYTSAPPVVTSRWMERRSSSSIPDTRATRASAAWTPCRGANTADAAAAVAVGAAQAAAAGGGAADPYGGGAYAGDTP